VKACPTCGEVFPEPVRRCPTHAVALIEWTGSTDVHVGAVTDVEIRLDRAETPFEVVASARVIAGEIDGRDLAHLPTPRDQPRRARSPGEHRIVGGRYHLGAQLGSGGYGAVFAAIDDVSGARVAIKVLSPIATQRAELVTRFHREAIAASRARHPHIVEVLDFDVDIDGSQYLVMEHLDGCDLADTLANTGALEPVAALAIAAQCARGLAAAHRAGILHRDLKPANVFLVQHGADTACVKIIDFGISKLTPIAGDYTDVTSASKVVGTPSYMSPEQARGEELDGRCDVYGLGVMLFEMLVGERPFTGQSPVEILSKHIDAPRVPPSSLQPALAACPGLDALVLTALAPERARRFPSMAAFGAALVTALRAIDPREADRVEAIAVEHTDTDRAAALQSSDITRRRRAAPRGRGIALTVGAAVVAAAVAVLVWMDRGSRPDAHLAQGPTSTLAATAAPSVIAPAPVVAAPSVIAPAAVAAAPSMIAPAPVAPAAIDAAPAPAPLGTPAAAPAGPFTVRITSTPRGAAVVRDGERLGATPLDVALAAGTDAQVLTIEAPGHRPRRIQVRRDHATLDVALERSTRTAPPAGAAKLGVGEW
jgi:serine/threonine-protein kinase